MTSFDKTVDIINIHNSKNANEKKIKIMNRQVIYIYIRYKKRPRVFAHSQ